MRLRLSSPNGTALSASAALHPHIAEFAETPREPVRSFRISQCLIYTAAIVLAFGWTIESNFRLPGGKRGTLSGVPGPQFTLGAQPVFFGVTVLVSAFGKIAVCQTGDIR